MDETVAEYIRSIVQKIPRKEIKTMLQKWGFLSEEQLQAIDFGQIKENIACDVFQLCEGIPGNIKEAAVLDMISSSCKHKSCFFFSFSCVTEKEIVYFDIRDFKKKFKRKLRSALGNVTINFREYEDNEIWIRIAWGTLYREPNQYRASYVVYCSCTPYVFISLSKYRSNLPLLCQALLAASNSYDICAMDLQGHCLNSLKDIVHARSNQNFQTSYSEPLKEHSVEPETGTVEENRKTNEKKRRMNQQVFGDGPLPKLEYAQYKLQTMFRSDPKHSISYQKEQFRCLVKLSSPDLLEALKSMAATSMVDAPVSPLLSCLPHRPRNHFRIKDKTD
ncbi:centromere protein N [Neopsephotus bourkii]|uniref:centromere protein N n=1 Tax=Neopsephotus bourkii TaxID=309878 RepID=UPI002AA51548|nr:centromere protein N [Neopsephotus bourkii]